MNQTTRQEPQNKKFRVATSLAFIVSIVVHACVFLIVGGVVIFDGKVPAQLFLSDLNGSAEESVTEIEMPPLLEEITEPEMIEDMTESVEMTDSLSMEDTMSTEDLILSSVVSTSINMPRLTGGFGNQLASGPQLKNPGTGTGRTGTAKSGPRGPSAATMFGSTNPSGGLIGRIYDLRRDQRGNEISTKQRYNSKVEEIIGSDGEVNLRKLEKYYSPDMELSAALFFIPGMDATAGPQAFGMETLDGRQQWITHYKGMLQPKKSGTYRFVGAGDELLIVRINGKLVLDATWQFKLADWTKGSPTGWKPDPSNPAPQHRRIGPGDGTYYGDWFELDGSPFDMEVTIGEGGGNVFGCVLAIQTQKDADEKIFSIFKTEDYQDSLQAKQQQGFGKLKDAIKLDGPTFKIPNR